jgi:hypothetical protein
MNLYRDSRLPIRPALAAAHQHTLDSFSRPGRWWDARERVAIAVEARAARVEAGLQEQCDDPVAEAKLPEAARRVARQVAVSTNALDRGFCAEALEEGLSDTQYCETVGIVSRLANLDVFARGIGVPPRPLAPPQAGEPTRERPVTARDEGAWIETVPGGRRGKHEAVAIYGTDTVEGAPFIYRALSLVPEEAHGLVTLGRAQYVEIADFMDLDFTFEPEISRVQMELLAARVSAINECFY